MLCDKYVKGEINAEAIKEMYEDDCNAVDWVCDLCWELSKSYIQLLEFATCYIDNEEIINKNISQEKAEELIEPIARLLQEMRENEERQHNHLIRSELDSLEAPFNWLKSF